LPSESLWSTERYLNFAPQLFEKLRVEVGPDIHLLHDVHHRLTPIEAARLGKALEPYHLFWLEDPCPAELQESFELIRRHTTTPLLHARLRAPRQRPWPWRRQRRSPRRQAPLPARLPPHRPQTRWHPPRLVALNTRPSHPQTLVINSHPHRTCHQSSSRHKTP